VKVLRNDAPAIVKIPTDEEVDEFENAIAL
jgi:hypothetical protein